MAYERNWYKVQQLFTVDGNIDGGIQVIDCAGFFVGAYVQLSSSSIPITTSSPIYSIKRISTETGIFTIYVGPADKNINSRSDVSAYTVADSASILQPEQSIPQVKEQYVPSLTYDHDPIRAIRDVLVDDHGNYYNDQNPIPVAFSAALPSTVEIASGDGSGDKLKVNGDGSINVIVETGSGQITKNVSKFNAISSVASGVSTTIVTYIVPALKTAILERVDVSGTNYATFFIKVNAVEQARRRTWYGNFNEVVNFTSPTSEGYALVASDVVTIVVLHTRPFLGDFEARIQVTQLG